MHDFEVRVLEAGRVVLRRIRADDVQSVAGALGVSASNVLSARMLQPSKSAQPVSTALSFRSERFPLRLFSRELSVLLRAGIPLLEAVSTLHEKESSPNVSSALRDVAEQLRQGLPLSAALATRPREFDALFVAVVSASERTGQLQQALRAHSEYLAWVEDLRSKLVAASVYPVMLVVAGLAVLLFLLVFVIPRFAGLLDNMGGSVPEASRMLIELGGFTGSHQLLTIAAGIALAAAPVFLLRLPAVRSAFTDLLWATPALGAKLRLLALARLYRTASMLLEAGVPLVAALRTAGGVASPHLRMGLVAATEAVSHGERLSVALEREKLVTPVSIQMIRVGERTGELTAMLDQAAAFYDEELSRLSDLITRLVNPLLMLLMGGLIGTVIVLMYLPIFQLVEQVQ